MPQVPDTRARALAEGEKDRMFPPLGSRHRMAQGHRRLANTRAAAARGAFDEIHAVRIEATAQTCRLKSALPL